MELRRTWSRFIVFSSRHTGSRSLPFFSSLSIERHAQAHKHTCKVSRSQQKETKKKTAQQSRVRVQEVANNSAKGREKGEEMVVKHERSVSDRGRKHNRHVLHVFAKPDTARQPRVSRTSGRLERGEAGKELALLGALRVQSTRATAGRLHADAAHATRHEAVAGALDLDISLPECLKKCRPWRCFDALLVPVTVNNSETNSRCSSHRKRMRKLSVQ